MTKLLHGLILIALLQLPAISAYAQKETSDPQPACLRLGADESLGPGYARFDALLTNLYERAGLCATSIAMSPKRIEQLMRTGELDGDWFRPADYVQPSRSNALMIPTPLFGLEARLIWLEPTKFSGNPADLKGLTVGYQAGFRWLESHIPTVGAKPFSVTSTGHIRELLQRGRIDVFATSGVHEAAILKTFPQGEAQVNSALWAAVPFHHLLQPHHADLVPALDMALQAMIKSGEIAEYLDMPGISVIQLTEGS